MDKPKILHTELKGNISERFEIIKMVLGMQNDAEVVRFLIQHYFRENLEKNTVIAREEIEKDREIIDTFMKRFGDEWRKLGE